jgi:shikimate kinase
MNWFLIGFSGSGKTTLGQRVAESLGYDFVDLDAVIEQREKKTISEIFEDKGELYFRNCETFYLKHFAASPNRIIATGGGAPCFNDNMGWMKLNGKIIYLKVDEKILHKRLSLIKDERPLFKPIPPENLKEHISDMLRMRELFYLQADEVVTVGENDERAFKSLYSIIANS